MYLFIAIKAGTNEMIFVERVEVRIILIMYGSHLCVWVCQFAQSSSSAHQIVLYYSFSSSL
uniref:Uncharacterized protein n=1 Tax=Arundo donax TaxID=35708 RepID=A0A0A9B4X7_ARUDO